MPELDLVSKGMTTCQGCAMELIARSALEVLGPKTITMTPPSCSAIITGNGDETGWGIPCVQTVLMSLPAFASGVSEALKIQGKNDVNVMGYAGDGGTFDIGFQALSGAIERGLAFVGNLAAIKPDIIDKIDVDQAVDEYADAIGMPPSIVRADDKVEGLRADRAKQQQAAQAAEMASQVAPAVKQGAEAAAGCEAEGPEWGPRGGGKKPQSDMASNDDGATRGGGESGKIFRLCMI